MNRETKIKLVIILDILSVIALAAVIILWLGGGDVFTPLFGQNDPKPLRLESESDISDGSTEIIDVEESTNYNSGAFSSGVPDLDGKKLCMIGDSRFAGMHDAVGDDEDILWIAKDGVGHDWYWSNKGDISALSRDTVIIYELGVNSIQPEKGIDALIDLTRLGFTDIYALSIAPVDEEREASHGYSITVDNVLDYNEYLKNYLPMGVKYMDVYTALDGNIVTYDGLHYDDETYVRWYGIILENIAENDE
ncbi:MAG: hypothetical protein K6B14_01045 [Lachnospiraceae bacterium]|nr:hypothetical protein [Lachnospiraceae bacterium]